MSKWASTVGLEMSTEMQQNDQSEPVFKQTEGGGCVSPQSCMSLNLHNIQGVEVGDKQVGLSIGCIRRGQAKVSGDTVKTFNPAEKTATITKRQRQAAPLDLLRAASSSVGVHKHTKLCHTNDTFSKLADNTSNRKARRWVKQLHMQTVKGKALRFGKRSTNIP